MIILGIDPGVATIGYAALDCRGSVYRAIGYDCITTQAGMLEEQRLLEIFLKISEVLELYQPQVVVLEKLFFNKNVRTAISVGQARGVVMLAVAQKHIQLREYTPTQVKLSVTGVGNANKRQVGYMVKSLLRLDDVPKPDDVADALALAICQAHTGNYGYILASR
jgi:crossover junction endodeoxyribonuclease RuvC